MLKRETPNKKVLSDIDSRCQLFQLQRPLGLLWLKDINRHLGFARGPAEPGEWVPLDRGAPKSVVSFPSS
ncbi:hypothetical protein BDD21_4562 [Thiocapsa rosea]|uniref:Uncharacterized protein n=1 Tax=Thiocapsa rosea TaxID=69360 RepID=A0A495VEH9_9GAMM|nr:hypothetical protein BDD21_4562 [Thiocapsa rosea]